MQPTTPACLRKGWVDGGCRKHVVEHTAALGIDLQIVQRTPAAREFTPIPRRWALSGGQWTEPMGRFILHRRPGMRRDSSAPLRSRDPLRHDRQQEKSTAQTQVSSHILARQSAYGIVCPV